MRCDGWLRTGVMMSALLMVCGCMPPWRSPSRPPPPTPRAEAQGGPTLPQVAPASGPPLATSSPPATQVGKPSTPPPPSGPAPLAEPAGALRSIQHEEPSSRQAAELAQRLAEARDESKILAARLQEFQAQIEDKNRALASARTEVRKVTDEIKQTREQIDHWSREVGNLRLRAETAEKENQASLKALAQMVEMIIVQETAGAGRPASPPTPVVP